MKSTFNNKSLGRARLRGLAAASLLAGALGGSLGAAGCGEDGMTTTPTPTMMPPVVNPPTTVPTTYVPQYPPLPPQVQRGLSGILTTPRVVPVFFTGEKLQTQLYTFIQNYMTRSTSWQVLKEYGVGYGTVAPAVVLTPPASTSLTDKDVQAYLTARIKDGTIVPDAQTMVIVYFPATITISNNGEVSCQAFAGYHGFAPQINGTNLAYSVIPRCSLETLSDLTYATSHELAEAASDPYLAAHNDLQDPYTLWQLNLSGAEIGDLCQNLVDARANENGVGIVTRLWSNAAMAAYENPCVPAPAGTSFFSVPIHTQLQTVQINTTLRKIEQISIRVGQTATVDVRLLATTSPSPTWTVAAEETPLLSATGSLQSPALTFAWVETPTQIASGTGGVTLHLKITAKAAGPVGYTTFRLISTGLTTAGIKTETDWVGVVQVTK